MTYELPFNEIRTTRDLFDNLNLSQEINQFYQYAVLFDLDTDLPNDDLNLLSRCMVTDPMCRGPVLFIKYKKRYFGFDRKYNSGMPSMCGGETTVFKAHRVYVSTAMGRLALHQPNEINKRGHAPSINYAGIFLTIIQGLPDDVTKRLFDVLYSAGDGASRRYHFTSTAMARYETRGKNRYNIACLSHNYYNWDDKSEWAEEEDELAGLTVDMGFKYYGSTEPVPDRRWVLAEPEDVYEDYPGDIGTITVDAHINWYHMGYYNQEPASNGIVTMLQRVKETTAPALISTNVANPCFSGTLDTMNELARRPGIEKEYGVYPLSPDYLGCNDNEGNHAIAATLVVPAPQEVRYI